MTERVHLLRMTMSQTLCCPNPGPECSGTTTGHVLESRDPPETWCGWGWGSKGQGCVWSQLSGTDWSVLLDRPGPLGSPCGRGRWGHCPELWPGGQGPRGGLAFPPRPSPQGKPSHWLPAWPGQPQISFRNFPFLHLTLLFFLSQGEAGGVLRKLSLRCLVVLC